MKDLFLMITNKYMVGFMIILFGMIYLDSAKPISNNQFVNEDTPVVIIVNK